MSYSPLQVRTCYICDEPIPYNTEHWCHEDDCPNYGELDYFSVEYPCDCDLYAHPECCPVCNPKEESVA
jgi:hypothetical protein